jgi:Fe-Mn family superoxide dismutase
MTTLPPLPYAKNALEPYISENTISYHYEKHHRGYCNKLKELISGTENEGKSLNDLILSSDPGPIFNNAAQIWNHSFYWMSMSDKHHQRPDNFTIDAISKHFDSIEIFKETFTQNALSLFGSGYTWLVYHPETNRLSILNTANAATPTTEGLMPILTCDVWEHAYYLDAQNLRAKYLENFFSVINWQFISDNLKKAGYEQTR